MSCLFIIHSILLLNPYAGNQPIHHFPSTDDILVSQPFNYEQMEAASNIGNYNEYFVAEDLVLPCDWSFDELEMWIVPNGDLATTFNIGIQGDTEAGPDGEFQWLEQHFSDYQEYVCPYPFGSSVWYVHVPITDAPVLQGPGTYWFCVQAICTTGNYWVDAMNTNPTWNDMKYCSGDNGLTWMASLQACGYEAGAFFILQGSTALDRSTWAEIKASF